MQYQAAPTQHKDFAIWQKPKLDHHAAEPPAHEGQHLDCPKQVAPLAQSLLAALRPATDAIQQALGHWSASAEPLGSHAPDIAPKGLGATAAKLQPAQSSSATAATGAGTGATPASTPEELKQAATDRDALQKQLDGMPKGKLSPEQEQAILERTKGLSGEALVSEMNTIEHALGSKNADRALNAYADLSKLMATDEKAAKRLTPDIVNMLVTGVANPRADTDRGQAGILGERQVKDAAQALLKMDEADYGTMTQLLAQAGTDKSGKAVQNSDAAAEQALLLQSVAARRDLFGDKSPTSASQSPPQTAMSDITQFASDIRGTNRKDLIHSTTVIDIGLDDSNKHDGLTQRFWEACSATTAQMTRAMADPIYARKLREVGVDHMDASDPIAQEQKARLEDKKASHGDSAGVAVARLGYAYEHTIDAAIGVASASYVDANGNPVKQGTKGASKVDPVIDPKDSRALTSYLYTGKLPENTKKDPELQQRLLDDLKAVQAKTGHPTDLELANLHEYEAEVAHTGKGYIGEGRMIYRSLEDSASDSTHVKYKGEGVDNKTMAAMDDALKQGQAVPIRVAAFNGHFMMVSDVRADEKGKESYLISDPYTGQTHWVTAFDLKSGNLAKTFAQTDPEHSSMKDGQLQGIYLDTPEQAASP